MELHDFNNPSHRIAAAGAVLQKGAYHLLTLQTEAGDVFARVLRMYQAWYLLCSALLLLDPSRDLNPRGKVHGPLGRRCGDPNRPSRAEIDPAALITHAMYVMAVIGED